MDVFTNSKICNLTRPVAVCKAFCKNDVVSLNKTIFESPVCSPAVGTLLVIFATLAGILTLILNGLLIWSINRKTRFSQLSPMDHFKSSLAVCGVLYGFSILFSYLPSVVWTFKQSLATLVEVHLKLTNSPLDYVLLMYVTFTFISTVYHLLLLSIMRLYAVTRVFESKNLRNQRVIAAIIMIWIVSFIISFTIFFFPNNLGVAYDGNLMYKFYALSKTRKNKSSVGIMVYSFLILLLPCLVMAALTFTTFVKVRIELKKASTLTKSSQRASKEKLKKERELLLYLVFLQIGSLILFIPFFVVTTLGFLKIDHDTLFFTFATYFSHCMGLMSVLVTLMRDSKFQADIKLLFKMIGSKCSFIKIHKKKDPINPVTASTSTARTVNTKV